MREFRTRLYGLKPGSIDGAGMIVGHDGRRNVEGPCFIPANIPIARKRMMMEQGWAKCPAKYWPSVLPAQGLFCIIKLDKLDALNMGIPF